MQVTTIIDNITRKIAIQTWLCSSCDKLVHLLPTINDLKWSILFYQNSVWLSLKVRKQICEKKQAEECFSQDKRVARIQANSLFVTLSMFSIMMPFTWETWEGQPVHLLRMIHAVLHLHYIWSSGLSLMDWPQARQIWSGPAWRNLGHASTRPGPGCAWASTHACWARHGTTRTAWPDEAQRPTRVARWGTAQASRQPSACI
jgi:hypothetical protein